MGLRLVYLIVSRLFGWLRLSLRRESWKSAEILLLRHQLVVLQRQVLGRHRQHLPAARNYRNQRTTSGGLTAAIETPPRLILIGSFPPDPHPPHRPRWVPRSVLVPRKPLSLKPPPCASCSRPRPSKAWVIVQRTLSCFALPCPYVYELLAATVGCRVTNPG